MTKIADTMASLVAEIAAYGEFLPGSARKTTELRTHKKTSRV